MFDDKLTEYEPPYGSPIEDYFAWDFVKCASSEVVATPQAVVPTAFGEYRLDFLYELGEKRIAVECDGKEYHNHYRDMLRDAAILATTEITRIYRFAGKDLHANCHNCLKVISLFDGDVFSERGLGIIDRHASPAFRKEAVVIDDFWSGDGDSFCVWGEGVELRGSYIHEDGDEATFRSSFIVRTAAPLGQLHPYWKDAYKFMEKNKGHSVAKIAELYEKQMNSRV